MRVGDCLENNLRRRPRTHVGAVVRRSRLFGIIPQIHNEAIIGDCDHHSNRPAVLGSVLGRENTLRQSFQGTPRRLVPVIEITCDRSADGLLAIPR